MTVREIQKALASLGYTLGAIDGIWGRQSAAALKAFQRDGGLEVDGIIGPQSLAALRVAIGAAGDGASAPLDDGRLVWFQEARNLIGTREKPGSGSNDTILDFADGLGIDYDSDDIPWCGLFVAHCIGSTLGTEPLPTSPLAARSWLRFGVKCPRKPGAVVVFWRVSPGGWQGHVGFYAGENSNGSAIRVLGGNQSDSVSLAWLGADRLLDVRWPSTVAHTEAGSVTFAKNAKLSRNEV